MDNPSDYYYKKGLDFLNDENYYEALMYLDKSIELNPDMANYLADKAICLSKLEMFDESRKFIDKAYNLSDDENIKFKRVEILLIISDNLIKNNELAKAEDIINELMRLSPNNEKIMNKKSEILVTKIKTWGYDEDEKLEILDEILELNPNYTEFATQKTEILVDKLEKIKTYGFEENEILKILNELIKLNPDNTEFINEKTEILVKRAEERSDQGSSEAALTLWTEIVNLNPENQEYKEKKIDILMDKAEQKYNLGDIEACLYYWDKITDLNPKYNDEKIEILLEIANNSYKKGYFDNCLGYWDKIIEIDSIYIEKETEFLLGVAKKEFEDENILRCLYCWDKIIELNPDNLEYIEKKFEIAYTQGSKEETNNSNVLKSIRNSIDTQRRFFQRNKFHMKELECCEELMQLTESNDELNSPMARRSLIQRKVIAFKKDEKFDEALKIIDKEISEIDDEEEIKEFLKMKSNVLVDISSFYYSKRKFNESLRYAEDSLKLNEDNESAMGLKVDSIKLNGIYLMNISEYDEAIEYYDNALNYINETPLKDRDNATSFIAALYNLKGLCYKYLFKYEVAIQYFNQSLKAEYLDYVDLNKIETLSILDNKEEALTMINSFLKKDPDNFLANRIKLEILLRLKRFEEAFNFSIQLVDEDYRHKRNWESIRNSIYSIKECSIGNDLMNQALEIDKDNAKFISNKLDCLYNLSKELYDVGFNNYALDCINELIALNDKNPSFWELKGKIFDRLLQFKESRECFDKALTLV